MRRIILLLTVVILLIPAPANAHGSRLYWLRTPSADEYIQGFKEHGYDEFFLSDFVRRYVSPDPTIPFASLADVYRTINEPTTDTELWDSSLINAWIKKKSIDPDQTSQFGFALNQISICDDYYLVNTRPFDFKGDGSHEWLLTVSVICSDRFSTTTSIDYMVATRASNGNYHVLPFPIPTDGNKRLLFSQPLIVDGNPEWFVVDLDFGRRYLPSHADWNALYILTLQNDHIVDLTASSSAPQLGGIRFPTNATFELSPSSLPHQYDLLINTPVTDNWGCQRTDTQTIRWDGTRWSDVKDGSNYTNTAECIWRNAESAMWSNQWPEAINLYQSGFARALLDPGKPSTELMQYIQFRLALAYLLEGQPLMSSAVAIILHSQKPASGLMQQLYDVLPRRPASDAYKVCAAAHDVFQQYVDQAARDIVDDNGDNSTGTYSKIPGTVVGMNHDITTVFGDTIHLPDPAKAGCDIALPLLAKLQSQPFTTVESPTDQLDARGFPVLHSLNLDINHDGRSEWLIWLDVDSPPLFFAENPDGQTYHVSDAPFRDGFHIFDGMVRMLPSHNGYALVGISTGGKFDSRHCPQFTGYDQTVGTTNPIGTLSLFRLQHSELVNMLTTALCDSYDQGFEASYFNGTAFYNSTNMELPGSINAYLPVKNTLSPFYADNLVQVSYNWDNKTQSYLPPSSIPPLADAPSNVYDWQFVEPFDAALNRKAYPAALQIADQAMLTSCTAQCDKANAVNDHFLRATVLEMMHRDNEALAEYEFVAENAASPGQYQLAMLHLEPIDF